MRARTTPLRSYGWSLLAVLATSASGLASDFQIVDTGQALCYDDQGEITCPAPGASFFGQDSQYAGAQPAYQDNGDGTISDLNTGLMWQQSPDFPTQRTWAQAQAYGASLQLAGYDDWRVPTLKELYALIDFRGSSTAVPPVPYIDTAYFDFEYPSASSGLRQIDVQFWSSTEYVGTTMNNDPTAFGVNFADGRIKGYVNGNGPGGAPFARFVRCVRGTEGTAVNDFVDNGDGTVSDLATGLMWTQADSTTEMNWEAALAHAEGLALAGHTDWRLPNAKELQAIVDYSRAPDATNPAQQGPAIDPIFGVTEEESWCWASTTHLENPVLSTAVYVCFGQAFGWMEQPKNSGNWVKLNVHGAGSQRSDPKDGDPSAYPHGHGPQGDEIRIFNYVRCVRDDAGCAAQAQNYCTAGTSASACNATVSASGTSSASASSGFVLTANDVEGAVAGGLFTYGSNGRQANLWGTAAGSCTSYQCVVPPLHRGGFLSGSGTAGNCDGTYAQDLNARWAAKPAHNPGAGAVVQGQFWYRDPSNPCSGGSQSHRTTSLSDAIEWVVCP